MAEIVVAVNVIAVQSTSTDGVITVFPVTISYILQKAVVFPRVDFPVNFVFDEFLFFTVASVPELFQV